ncbi:MAG: hypothetical protein ACREFY_08860 [Acetobacteraceae bacterium]
MLAGTAVVAIWNDLAPGMRVEFQEWHLREHIPERVDIPGFRRGRRLVAADAATRPAYFTLYEADSMDVLCGAAYAARLNAPTEQTRRVTARFRDTTRTLARVIGTAGLGPGGAMLTLRFSAGPEASATLAALVRDAAEQPQITGAHLCVSDSQASGVRSAESVGRTDLLAPPAWFVLVEATDPEALAGVITDAALLAAGAEGEVVRGVYRLEYLRAKAAPAPKRIVPRQSGTQRLGRFRRWQTAP